MKKQKETVYCWVYASRKSLRVIPLRFRFDPIPGTYRYGYGIGQYRERHHRNYGASVRNYNLGYFRAKKKYPSLKSEWWEGEPLREKPSKSWKDQSKRRHQWKPKQNT